MRILERKAQRKSKAKLSVKDDNVNTAAPQNLCSICEKSAEISNPCAECLNLIDEDFCVRQTNNPDSSTELLEASHNLLHPLTNPFKEVSAADAADVRRSITQAHNQFVSALRDAESLRQFDDHNLLLLKSDLSANENVPSVQRTNRMKKVAKSNAQEAAGHKNEGLPAICTAVPDLCLIAVSITIAGSHAVPVPSNEGNHEHQDGVDGGNSLRSITAVDWAASTATAGAHAVPVPSNEGNHEHQDEIDGGNSLRSISAVDWAASTATAGAHALPVPSNEHKQDNADSGVSMARLQLWLWGF